MYNKDYYPTPENLAMKMLSKIEVTKIKTILEPSAGKGNLIDALYKRAEEEVKAKYKSWGIRRPLNDKPSFDIDCVEIEPELRQLLKSKGLRVVGDDFLRFNTYKHYDLCLANFPFSSGAKHLLHALEIMKGGKIICLINAETIRNQYSNDRIALVRKLNDYGADIEFISGSFLDAERESDVEVALISVDVPEEKSSFILEGMRKSALENFEETDDDKNEIEMGNVMLSLVRQYERETEAGVRLINEYFNLRKIMLEETGDQPQISLSVQGNDPSLINGFLRNTRRRYWAYFLNHPKFTGRLTSNLKQSAEKLLDEMQECDFSEFNAQQMMIQLTRQMNSGIEESIIKMFDKFSAQYAYYTTSNNIHYYNGWSTNKAWIINKKVIIPLNAYQDFCGYNPAWYEIYEQLADMEKAFAYLEGKSSDGEALRAELNKAKEERRDKIETRYFTIEFKKKGTAHIWFKDLELLKKFNIYGSQKKGWLPQSYGRKSYKDMNEKEKAVVDAFDGGESGYKHSCESGLIVLDNNFSLAIF